MADNSWRNLDVWERVKWARSLHYESAVEAAHMLGMKDGTYRCYERGPDSAKFIQLDYRHARTFAQAFKVKWEWLIDGVGEPWLTKPPEDDFDGGPEEGPPPPSHFLRAWREHAQMTVAELAKKAGLAEQTIGELESGRMEPSTKLLEQLAPPLNTKAGYLLSHDPEKMSINELDMWASIPKERRRQAMAILRTFREKQK